VLSETTRRAQQRLRRRGAERHQQCRAYSAEFGRQPGQAGPGVFDSGRAVNPDLPLAPTP
jgi:hypothetical protein